MRVWAVVISTLAVATLAFAAAAQAYVYWANPSGNAIGRANLDGTDANPSFISGAATAPRGVAVDGAHIYWTNGTGFIGRANLDGTEANPSFIVAPVSEKGSTLAIGAGSIYWVSRYGASPGEGSIGRANLDGTNVDPNFITGISAPVGGVAVDASHVYWTSMKNPFLVLYQGPIPTAIGRANLDGTGIDESFLPQAFPTAYGVTVDAAHLWWTSGVPKGTGQTPAAASVLEYAVRRAAPDGTGAESVTPDGEFESCGGLAVGDTHVYWAQSASIGRARLDGTRGTGELIRAGASCSGVAVDGLGPPPSNEFSVGKAKRDTEHGWAKLTVDVAGPGELDLAKTASVKGASDWADHGGTAEITVKPRGAAKERLRKRGAAKVTAAVTFTPDGGTSATATKKIKLSRD